MTGTQLKEIRLSTGMTQKEFSKFLDIPLSTLTKWEQDINKPPHYVFKMIRLLFPFDNKELIKIAGPHDRMFYLNNITNEVIDCLGNKIIVNVDFNNVNKHNLGIYLNECFNDFYKIQNKLIKDCEYDIKEGIIW